MQQQTKVNSWGRVAHLGKKNGVASALALAGVLLLSACGGSSSQITKNDLPEPSAGWYRANLDGGFHQTSKRESGIQDWNREVGTKRLTKLYGKRSSDSRQPSRLMGKRRRFKAVFRIGQQNVK